MSVGSEDAETGRRVSEEPDLAHGSVSRTRNLGNSIEDTQERQAVSISFDNDAECRRTERLHASRKNLGRFLFRVFLDAEDRFSLDGVLGDIHGIRCNRAHDERRNLGAGGPPHDSNACCNRGVYYLTHFCISQAEEVEVIEEHVDCGHQKSDPEPSRRERLLLGGHISSSFRFVT